MTRSSIVSAPYSMLDSYSFEQESIKQIVHTAEYQLNLYGQNIPTQNWLVGAFFSAFVAAFGETGDEWYINEAIKWGERSEWDIKNRFNADDVCPGQTYLVFSLKVETRKSRI